MNSAHPIAFKQAIEHHRAGRLDDAERIYRQILSQDANFFDAVHMLGLLLHHRGQSEAGLDFLRRALLLNPDSADLQLNLAVVYGALARGDECAKHACRALELRPDDYFLVDAMAMLLSHFKRAEEATVAWQRATELRPDSAEAFSNLSVTLEWQGRYDESQRAIARALELNPSYANAHHNLGVLHERQGRFNQAIECYDRAIQLRPDHADAYANLANVLQLAGNIDGAIDAARRAITLRPDHLIAHQNLANALQEKGEMEAAAQICESCCRLLKASVSTNPGASQTAVRMRAINAALLPPIYQDLADLERWRSRFIDNISRMADDGVKLDLTAQPAPVIFSLAYQGRDDREIQKTYASLMSAPQLPGRGPRRGGKIKVGFISRFFRSHTIGRLNVGLIENLSRDVFDVTVFSVGTSDEPVARKIQQAADQYIPISIALEPARGSIAAQNLDLLFYTDLGMDPITFSLAFSRLAPVQCVTWGHPVTTGIPTIDYFLSSDLLEPDASECQYTEKLIRLPNLAVCYHRPELGAHPKSRAQFGLPEDAHLYGCLQMLQKFHPDFDELIAGVLRRDPKGLLLLIHGLNKRWDELLLRRFARTMGDVVDRVRFLDQMPYDDFLSFTALCDVMLDPIHFGGGNTSYEAFAFGVPVVTLPSQLLRGRITLALCRMMNLPECVASSNEQYIETASRMGMDRDYRLSIRSKIFASNSVLFENMNGVRELQTFLQGAVAT